MKFLKSAILKSLLPQTKKSFARTIPLKQKKPVAEIISPTLNTPLLVSNEDFFPEFILTLKPQSFFEFFNKNNQKFLSTSWINCLRKSFEIFSDDSQLVSSQTTVPFLEEIIRQVSIRFPDFTESEQALVLHLLALNDFFCLSILDYVNSTQYEYTSASAYTHLYLLHKLPVDSPRFEQFKRFFREKYLLGEKVEIKAYSQLVLSLEVFLLKTKDIDAVDKIESGLIKVIRSLHTHFQLRVLQIYADTKLKEPNLEIIEQSFDVLAQNLHSLSFENFNRCLFLLEELNVRSVQFMGRTLRYLLDQFADKEDLESREVELVCKAFHVFAKMDVC